MLKAALKLKDALVLRCGMELQSGRDDKGEWLKATYYDEDGTSTSERFRLQTPAQRKAFEMLFLRPHQRARACRSPGTPPPTCWRNSRRCAIRISWWRANAGSFGRCARKCSIIKAVSAAPINWPEPTVPNLGRFSLPCGRLSVKCRALYLGLPSVKAVSELATWVACSRVNFL